MNYLKTLSEDYLCIPVVLLLVTRQELSLSYLSHDLLFLSIVGAIVLDLLVWLTQPGDIPNRIGSIILCALFVAGAFALIMITVFSIGSELYQWEHGTLVNFLYNVVIAKIRVITLNTVQIPFVKHDL